MNTRISIVSVCITIFIIAVDSDGTICSESMPPVECFVNPCKFAECKAHPDAICVTDFSCRRCDAKFFDDQLNEVTDSCSKIF